MYVPGTSSVASIRACTEVLHSLNRSVLGQGAAGHTPVQLSESRAVQGMEGRQSPRQLQPIPWLFCKLSGRVEMMCSSHLLLSSPSLSLHLCRQPGLSFRSLWESALSWSMRYVHSCLS